MSDAEYGAGVDVVLPDGSFVPDPDSPTGHMRAPIPDLRDVALASRRTREMNESLLARPESRESASGYLLLTLALNLGQGGVFDYQRRGNRVLGYRPFQKYRPVANFNIGLFAQQAGLTIDEALKLSGFYASIFSRNARPDRPSGLNDTNEKFIRDGFAVGERGLFDQSLEER